MADNRLKQKAISNYQAGLGWYTGDAEGDVVPTYENRVVMKGQQPNPRKKHVMVGRARMRIKGM